MLKVASEFRGSSLRQFNTRSCFWLESHPGSKDYRLWELFLSYITTSNFHLSTQIILSRNNEDWIRQSSEINTKLFPHQTWFDFNIKIAEGFNFLKKLLEGKVLFMVDGSFFPERSSLILAIWYASVDNKIVAHGDFISLVLEEYCHLYAVELCGVLSIMVGIDSILSRYPHPSTVFETEIRSDCQLVIHSL